MEAFNPLTVKIFCEPIGHLHLVVKDKEDLAILEAFFKSVIDKAAKTINYA